MPKIVKCSAKSATVVNLQNSIIEYNKIATPSLGGDFVVFVLLLVLFEELGDEGGDFFCFAADAVVFAFDDGEL